MLKIIAVDLSAKSRQRVTEQLQSYFNSAADAGIFTSRVSVQALSVEELRFHGNPDLYFIGEDLFRSDPSALATLSKACPLVSILVEIGAEQATLGTIEQLLRLGATDVFVRDSGRDEFLRKFLVLTRNRKVSRAGKLIVVDSAKGGLGVTSFAAALGELLLDQRQRVCLVDLDTESQDLSRFLQARPFVNENLQSLLEKQRSINEESVGQTAARVWQDVELFCVAPPLDSEKLVARGTAAVRTFLEVLEVLDASFDYVIIDPGCCRGGLLEMLYSAADLVTLVVNNDAAALYASLLKVNQIRVIAPSTRLHVIENCPLHHGLSNALLRREFLRAAQLNAGEWIETSVPFSRSASKWPASGGTLYSQGGIKLRTAFNAIASGLGVVAPEKAAASPSIAGLFKFMRHRLPQPPLIKALPAPASTQISAGRASEENCEPEELRASALISGVSF